MMVGRSVAGYRAKAEAKSPAPLLQVQNLTSPGVFENVSFDIRPGEIVGFAGLVGAGRSEVAKALFGLDPNATGSVTLDGRPLPLGSIKQSMARGIGLVPEDRKRQGLVLGLSCRENTSLAALPELSRWGWVRRKAERALSRKYAERLRVKAPTLETIVAGLSGGNQQKVALAKWLARHCDVLIVDEPTRGVDVGAKAEIYQLLDELACEGKAILVISSEMPELIGLCRRILVMREGRLVGELAHGEFSESGLMQLMAGVAVS
jgi:ABC-type sugar transport system ATPase subunit